MKSLFSTLFTLLCFSSFGQTFINYTTANGLLSDNVRDLAIDSNGDLWFATQNGVSTYDGTMWRSFTTASDTGLVNNNIETIAAASNGDIWVGTSFGASLYSAGKWSKYTTANGLGNNQIRYIEQANNGDIWLATIDGATVFDGTTWTSYGTVDGLPFGGINHIAEASNGDIWLGTGLGGIEVFDGTSFTEIRASNGLLSDQIRSVLFDEKNNSWIAMANGISVLDTTGAVMQHHTRPFVLPAPDTLNPVVDLVIDTNENIWASVYVDYLVTEGGICMYNGSHWIQYDMSDGLAGPNVRRMEVDANNNLWVATSTGVSKVTSLPTSIDQLISDGGFRLDIYPNPSGDVVNLSYAQNPNARFIMSDLMGNTVLEGTVNQQVSVHNLASGVYFFRVGTGLKKFVKID